MVLINITGYGQAVEPVCAGSIQKYGVTGPPGSYFDWTVLPSRGEVIDGQGTDTVTIQWKWVEGDVNIDLNTTIDGHEDCIGSTTTKETLRKPAVDLGPDKEICQGDSIVLDAGTSYEPAYHFTWNNTAADSSQYFTVKQSEVVILKVTDGFMCVNSDSVNIIDNPLPIVDFGYNDTTLCDGNAPYNIWADNLIQPSNEFLSAVWYYNSAVAPDPYEVSQSQKIDTLVVVIKNTSLCSNSDTMYIKPCDIDKIEIPNSFTPNDDQVNDKWVIPTTKLYSHAILEIFDRWGRLVYRTEHVWEEPWDGKSKGNKMPMDSYYYVLDYNPGSGRAKTGTVNLIR
jgi:gliding motility-associated-like protein